VRAKPHGPSISPNETQTVNLKRCDEFGAGNTLKNIIASSPLCHVNFLHSPKGQFLCDSLSAVGYSRPNKGYSMLYLLPIAVPAVAFLAVTKMLKGENLSKYDEDTRILTP